MIINIDENNIEILGATVLVEFGAAWCSPCQRMKPELEQLSTDLEDVLAIAQIDVDEHPDLVSRYNIQSVPTILFIKDGVELIRMIGLQNKVKILEKINKFI